MKKSELRQIIREELKNSSSPTQSDVKEFITQVLKVGTKQNLFDSFLKRKNINSNELSTFVKMVADELKKY
jgi:nucleoid DNA-binding protein